MAVDPRKVGAGMAVLVVFLVMALAYNMGGSAQESKDAPLIDMTNGRVTATQRRLNQCRDKVGRLQDEQRHTDDVAKEVQHSVDTLRADSDVLQQNVLDLRARVDTCQKTKDSEQSDWDDSPDSTVEDRIRQLNTEIAAANQTLDTVIANRVADDQDMLRLLLALRRANAAMVETIGHDATEMPTTLAPKPSETTSSVEPASPTSTAAATAGTLSAAATTAETAAATIPAT
eukprot:CAMPEP_0174844700 /NCGR_PEP_ID=MMETSP1114-20130205/11261_1 /TAXON_ID=312471 /ORGANISM="Neobodo designis, Strain CCAP 1951/1" /LENGTH=230 /DNA_ID=CAMNT_0016078943 /DNA_START=45 /DNA_END=734 /DNA_ORIENTATION=+